MNAPVVLFCYNRPWHVEKTLSFLSKNILADQSLLVIYSDGAKNAGDLKNVLEVRSVLRKKMWCKEVRIIESENNKGLAQSIIEGVTETVNEFGKAIVLEDDMLASRFFLQFMNDALNMYEKDGEVSCISGYFYPIKEKLPETFFIRGADCWGWGTWKHAWNIFEKDGVKLLAELKSKALEAEFNFNNSYPFSQMLERQIMGKNNSWAVRWMASAFLKEKLVLYPSHSLIHNTGNDLSGSHQLRSKSFDVVLSDEEVHLAKTELVENKLVRKMIEEYFREAIKEAPLPTGLNSLKSSIKKWVKKIT